MKKPLLAFFILFLFSSPVFAQTGTVQEQLIAHFGQIAAALQCPQYAFSDMKGDKNSGLIEYLPEGQNLDSWTRMVTVNMFLLPQKKEQYTEYMKGLKQHLLSSFRSNAEVGEVMEGVHEDGTPVLLMEYETGEGDSREHALAIYARFFSSVSAMMHLQVRGGKLSDQDRMAMKTLYADLIAK